MKRLWPTISRLLMVLMMLAMGARVWLARKEKEEREARMRSMMEFTSKANREVDARMQKKFADDQREELRRQTAALEEMGKRIKVPPPLQMERVPGGATSVPVQPLHDGAPRPH